MTLFLERGFDATTVDDIAEAADVSKRSFFDYFPTKEDVVQAWQDEFGADLAAAIVARPAGEPLTKSSRRRSSRPSRPVWRISSKPRHRRTRPWDPRCARVIVSSTPSSSRSWPRRFPSAQKAQSDRSRARLDRHDRSGRLTSRRRGLARADPERKHRDLRPAHLQDAMGPARGTGRVAKR